VSGAVRERIGLFGGSFNPIHLAHLRSAEEVRERCGLDEVRFVLAAAPPHKGPSDLAPAADRLRMIELAIDGAAGLRASAMEIRRGGTSYSIDTIREILRRPDAPERLVFVLVLPRPGTRAALTLDDFPVAARPRFCYDPLRDAFRHDTGHTVTLLPVPPLDISATEIRRRVRDGRSIRYLVPPAVERHIRERGLYRAAGGRYASS
jgi:nicotinate-nucleotide adenylyltransferase